MVHCLCNRRTLLNIEVLQATMPVTVFLVGVLLGTEKYTNLYALNMVVVAVGVAAASYGEDSQFRGFQGPLPCRTGYALLSASADGRM